MLVKIKQASEILKRFGYELEPEFEGFKDYWHPWHQGRKIWMMSFEERVNRIIQIENTKDESEKPIRFKYFKPVIGEFECSDAYKARSDAYKAWSDAYKARSDAYKARSYAYKAWRDADKAWRDADKAWRDADKACSDADKARRDADKAWRDADKAWRDAPIEFYINELHAKECEGINWNEERQEMMFE